MLVEDTPAKPSLIDYAMSVKDQTRQVFLVHGEERAAAVLRERLGERGLKQTVSPDWHESVEI
jgi:predicted metal-dependent RNase